MIGYVLWFFVLTWPLWNRLINSLLLKSDKEAIRSWRKRKLFGALGISLVSTRTASRRRVTSSTSRVDPRRARQTVKKTGTPVSLGRR